MCFIYAREVDLTVVFACSLSIVTSTHLSRLVVIWTEYLVSACGRNKDDIERGYNAIVKAMGSLFFIQGK